MLMHWNTCLVDAIVFVFIIVLTGSECKSAKFLRMRFDTTDHVASCEQALCVVLVSEAVSCWF